MKIITLLSAFFFYSISFAQLNQEKKIEFKFYQLRTQESLKINIYVNEDDSVAGNAIHSLPAKFSMTPDEKNMQIDKIEISYPLVTNQVNSDFIKNWLDKMNSIDIAKQTLNYWGTEDGSISDFKIIIGENTLEFSLRNIESNKSSKTLIWISKLIDHLGINSSKIFNY